MVRSDIIVNKAMALHWCHQAKIELETRATGTNEFNVYPKKKVHLIFILSRKQGFGCRSWWGQTNWLKKIRIQNGWVVSWDIYNLSLCQTDSNSGLPMHTRSWFPCSDPTVWWTKLFYSRTAAEMPSSFSDDDESAETSSSVD